MKRSNPSSKQSVCQAQSSENVSDIDQAGLNFRELGSAPCRPRYEDPETGMLASPPRVPFYTVTPLKTWRCYAAGCSPVSLQKALANLLDNVPSLFPEVRGNIVCQIITPNDFDDEWTATLLRHTLTKTEKGWNLTQERPLEVLQPPTPLRSAVHKLKTRYTDLVTPGVIKFGQAGFATTPSQDPARDFVVTPELSDNAYILVTVSVVVPKPDGSPPITTHRETARLPVKSFGGWSMKLGHFMKVVWMLILSSMWKGANALPAMPPNMASFDEFQSFKAMFDSLLFAVYFLWTASKDFVKVVSTGLITVSVWFKFVALKNASILYSLLKAPVVFVLTSWLEIVGFIAVLIVLMIIGRFVAIYCSDLYYGWTHEIKIVDAQEVIIDRSEDKQVLQLRNQLADAKIMISKLLAQAGVPPPKIPTGEEFQLEAATEARVFRARNVHKSILRLGVLNGDQATWIGCGFATTLKFPTGVKHVIVTAYHCIPPEGTLTVAPLGAFSEGKTPGTVLKLEIASMKFYVKSDPINGVDLCVIEVSPSFFSRGGFKSAPLAPYKSTAMVTVYGVIDSDSDQGPTHDTVYSSSSSFAKSGPFVLHDAYAIRGFSGTPIWSNSKIVGIHLKGNKIPVGFDDNVGLTIHHLLCAPPKMCEESRQWSKDQIRYMETYDEDYDSFEEKYDIYTLQYEEREVRQAYAQEEWTTAQLREQARQEEEEFVEFNPADTQDDPYDYNGNFVNEAIRFDKTDPPFRPANTPTRVCSEKSDSKIMVVPSSNGAKTQPKGTESTNSPKPKSMPSQVSSKQVPVKDSKVVAKEKSVQNTSPELKNLSQASRNSIFLQEQQRRRKQALRDKQRNAKSHLKGQRKPVKKEEKASKKLN